MRSTGILRRMGERCDPYIYHTRVRTFMSGWTHESMPPAGLAYEGVPATAGASAEPWRSERYFGETGAQSSVVPALDAALGVGMSEDELLPYLLQMRLYMPPEHAAFIEALERGPPLRDAVAYIDKVVTSAQAQGSPLPHIKELTLGAALVERMEALEAQLEGALNLKNLITLDDALQVRVKRKSTSGWERPA